MRGNSVLLSFPRQPEFYLLQKHIRQLKLFGQRTTQLAPKLLRLWRAIFAPGARVWCARQALSGGSPTLPDIPENGGTDFPPTFSWCVYVCVRVHICVLENGKKWRRRIPPKKFKSEHAVVVAMLIIYFLNFFFIFHCFTSKSNISSAFHMYLFTFFMVVFVRFPFCCFCVGVCLPLIYLSFYSQNSS